VLPQRNISRFDPMADRNSQTWLSARTRRGASAKPLRWIRNRHDFGQIGASLPPNVLGSRGGNLPIRDALV